MSIVSVVFIVLLLLNMPVAYVIGISSCLFFLLEPNIGFSIAAQKMVVSTQSFTFLSVPFFLTAGCIMNAAGITDRLVNFAKTLTGHLVGGLAQVSIILSALMGGISGSAVADASMEARFLGPSMLKDGYSKAFTAAVLSFGGLITATIPPSMGLIMYGYVGNVSVGKLFVAGIIPGILMTAVLMIPTHFISKRRGYRPVNPTPPTAGELWISFRKSFWALMFPVILVVGIRFGIFTTSEAGAFAIVYAVFVGKFIYKELNFKNFMKVLDSSITDNGSILMIVICAGIFSYILTYSGAPAFLAEVIGGVTRNKYVLLLGITLFLTFMGMIMDSAVNTLIFTPIFLPILQAVGVNGVHFGIIMMTVVTMGCMTPPVGTAMFSVCHILDCPTDEYMKEGMPYLIAILAEVLLIIFVPQIATGLVTLVYGSC